MLYERADWRYIKHVNPTLYAQHVYDEEYVDGLIAKSCKIIRNSATVRMAKGMSGKQKIGALKSLGLVATHEPPEAAETHAKDYGLMSRFYS